MSLPGLYRVVVGDPGDFDARHRIVNGMGFIGALMSVVVAAVDMAFKNPVFLAGAAAALVASLVLYVHSRVLRKSAWVAMAATLVCYTGVYATAWFEQGGILGGSAFLIVVLLPSTLLVSPSRLRYLLFLAVGLAFAGLVLWEAFDPGVRVGGSLESTRFLDSMAVFVICAGGVLALFGVGVRSLRSERARAAEYAAEIERLASMDGLTGLLTHSAIWKAAEDETARARRTGRTYSLIMADLDKFKGINDEFGHMHGDRILESAGNAIRASIRSTDRAGRYGGEEFLIVLPETDEAGAVIVAERMLGAMAAISVDGGSRVVSCSFGVAQFDGRGVAETVQHCDELMYRAKRAGGGRIEAGGSGSEGGKGQA